jgi:hypothetical protein
MGFAAVPDTHWELSEIFIDIKISTQFRKNVDDLTNQSCVTGLLL